MDLLHISIQCNEVIEFLRRVGSTEEKIFLVDQPNLFVRRCQAQQTEIPVMQFLSRHFSKRLHALLQIIAYTLRFVIASSLEGTPKFPEILPPACSGGRKGIRSKLRLLCQSHTTS